MNLSNAALAANRVVPLADEMQPNQRALNMERETIMVGICHDLPNIRPSRPEISDVLRIPQTTVHAHLKRWAEKPWRDRHGWLMLAEGSA